MPPSVEFLKCCITRANRFHLGDFTTNLLTYSRSECLNTESCPVRATVQPSNEWYNLISSIKNKKQLYSNLPVVFLGNMSGSFQPPKALWPGL